MSSSLGDNKLFLDPSTTSTLYSLFYLVNLIQYYYLSVKFVIWIVKQKIENKRNLFVKTCKILVYGLRGFIFIQNYPNPNIATLLNLMVNERL